jgi:creatinine amidohydrolase/Fe(II)-dependent formamide hydrolase-like protein
MDRVLEWARLNSTEIAGLDRSSSVLLLPMGHIQPHGPHLPQGTASFAAWDLALETADLLGLTHRDRHVILLPLLSYGACPPDGPAPKGGSIPDSLTLRPETLTSLIIDLAHGVLRNGFKNLFTIGHQAGPEHSQAVQTALNRVKRDTPDFIAEEICAYLAAGAAANAAPNLRTLTARRISPVEQSSVEHRGHGGTTDTAIMLDLDANLVSTDYMTMPAISEDEALHMDNWPGYFGGAPSLAEADLGRALLLQEAYRTAFLIRKALAGESLADLLSR